MKDYLVFGLSLLVLLIVVVQSFQIAEIKNTISGKASQSGETYDEMMARMHPDQAAQVVQTRATAQAPTMVGGC